MSFYHQWIGVNLYTNSFRLSVLDCYAVLKNALPHIQFRVKM